MKKSVLIFIAFFTLAAGSSAVYLALKPKNSESQTGLTTTTNETPVASQATENTGVYVDYQADIIAQTMGKKVLFFYAPWCSQCRSIEAGIKEQGVPAGLTIIKVDYDSNQDLRKKYGVTLQTTFVKVDDNGENLGLYVAYDEPTFDAVKRNFID